MDYGGNFWLNGQLTKSDKGNISIMNHCLHYGSGAFEGIRFYETEQGPAIFRAKEHYNRLHYSASVIEFEIPFSTEKLTEATKELILANEFTSGYIRPVVFYGEGKMGLNPKGAKEEVLIANWAWGKYLSDDPITVGVSPWQRISPQSLQCDAKINGHYINSIMSSQWAKKNNYQEALLLDFKGNVAEGPGENIFYIKDGQVFTPPLGTILAGITRQTIIELLDKEFNIKVIEQDTKVEDLLQADEAFFTGTAAEITIIKSINGQQIGQQDNRISNKIKNMYADIVCGRIEKYHHWLTFCAK
jgi:branched-chain amino acid aminotransferase